MNMRIVAVSALLVASLFGAANSASAAPLAGSGAEAKAQLVSDGRTLTCAQASCFTAANGNSSAGKVNFKQGFASVTSVCATFVFQGNLLDPGEEIDVTFDVLAPSLGAGNNGTVPLSSRQICTSDPDITALFKDGTQSFTTWEFTRGSVELKSVSFQLS